MSAIIKQDKTASEPLPQYQRILVAVDSSPYSNQAQQDALEIAKLWQSSITGTHVFAAKLHDIRFKQMEGGLPEQFRIEQELERQRVVHDDLITRGLSIITDSYLDQTEKECQNVGIQFFRKALEGKNYHALVSETNSGNYDLLVMGAKGLGAIQNTRLGTVCMRTCRRSNIDTLVIKNPELSIIKGPIVVALDGSAKSYGGLLRAFSIALQWKLKVEVISAFDPYFHYVAFNRIADVLSEEAGKVFRFKEQEKLHEEIIDSGLAKIYQGHLDVAVSIADEYGIEIETTLLDGKPHDAIEKYLKEVNPSLLVIGKTGIHADPDLDIGGNSELLLQNINCAVLLTEHEFTPAIDVLADVTTTWTVEAQQRMLRVPDFVQNMARMAILRYAQQRGHTVITERLVDEATAELMPRRAEQAMHEIVDAFDAGELNTKNPSRGFDNLNWSEAAQKLLLQTEDDSVRENIRKRAEKKARVDNSKTVELAHLKQFIEDNTNPVNQTVTLNWQTAALARLMRVPEGFMRDNSKKSIETYATKNTITDITLAVCESGLAEARKTMEQTMLENTEKPYVSKCPFANIAKKKPTKANNFNWSDCAEKRMSKIPEGFMRDLTRQRVEVFAKRKGFDTITSELIDGKYQEWAAGSNKQQAQLQWEPTAWERISKIPDFVRGMVLLEVERCARDMKLEIVNQAAVDRASEAWKMGKSFHSNPEQYKD